MGPVPISFHINDANGQWFNSNLNVTGTQALAVAVQPKLNIGKLLGGVLPSLSASNLPLLGNGKLGQLDLSKVVNGDLTVLAGNGTHSASTPCVTIKNSLVRGMIDTKYASYSCGGARGCGPVVIADSEMVVHVERYFYVGHSYNAAQIITGAFAYQDGAVLFSTSRFSTDEILGVYNGRK